MREKCFPDQSFLSRIWLSKFVLLMHEYDRFLFIEDPGSAFFHAYLPVGFSDFAP